MVKEEFGNLLEQYLMEKRDTMLSEYNRVLPTGELLFNRFDKNTYLNGGEGSSVYDTSVIMGNVKIGNHVWIGPYTLLEGINGKLTIGDYVSVDSGVMIYTHDSTKYYISGGKEPIIKGDVAIGNNTVIGTMSVITCGVKVGNHCVIAANSFVNKDISDNHIAAGNPAKIIGEVTVLENGEVKFEYL